MTHRARIAYDRKHVLPYAGFLGHAVVLIIDRGPTERAARLHCNEVAHAMCERANVPHDHGIIYQRRGRRWVEVRS